ncbi:MAG: HipA N-terminal domain-containing protein [Bacteroidales bacterium]|nr:HipA N-terminal domain-containing protein [Bacteroidales bacterium]
MKRLLNLFWSQGAQKQFEIVESESFSFGLFYNQVKVGSLNYNDGIWTFEYTEDFKSQKTILPLINFPNKEKTYSSKDLWPFFASRIPSNAQLQKNDDEVPNLIDMLKKFGKNVISNPYVLSAD